MSIFDIFSKHLNKAGRFAGVVSSLPAETKYSVIAECEVGKKMRIGYRGGLEKEGILHHDGSRVRFTETNGNTIFDLGLNDFYVRPSFNEFTIVTNDGQWQYEIEHIRSLNKVLDTPPEHALDVDERNGGMTEIAAFFVQNGVKVDQPGHPNAKQ